MALAIKQRIIQASSFNSTHCMTDRGHLGNVVQNHQLLTPRMEYKITNYHFKLLARFFKNVFAKFTKFSTILLLLWTHKNTLLQTIMTPSLVKKVFRSFTEVKVSVSQCKNTPLKEYTNSLVSEGKNTQLLIIQLSTFQSRSIHLYTFCRMSLLKASYFSTELLLLMHYQVSSIVIFEAGGCGAS